MINEYLMTELMNEQDRVCVLVLEAEKDLKKNVSWGTSNREDWGGRCS
jgi:hypothetical protein